MERAERFVFLGVGLAFDILVPVLWVMLVLTAFTAADRFLRVYQQADRPQRPHTTAAAGATVHERRRRDGNGTIRADARRSAQWWAARRVDGSASRAPIAPARRSPRP